MSILMTGGSGFIGGHFNSYLLNRDFVNLDSKEPSFIYKSLFIRVEIRIEETIRRKIIHNNIKAIVSLAANYQDFVRDEISTERMVFKPDSPYGATELASEREIEKWLKIKGERRLLSSKTGDASLTLLILYKKRKFVLPEMLALDAVNLNRESYVMHGLLDIITKIVILLVPFCPSLKEGTSLLIIFIILSPVCTISHFISPRETGSFSIFFSLLYFSPASNK